MQPKLHKTKFEILTLYSGYDGMVKNISRYCPVKGIEGILRVLTCGLASTCG
jgi:hypothetical protein